MILVELGKYTNEVTLNRNGRLITIRRGDRVFLTEREASSLFAQGVLKTANYPEIKNEEVVQVTPEENPFWRPVGPKERRTRKT